MGPAPRTAGRKFIAESGAGGTPLRASALDSLDSSLAAVTAGALAALGPSAASGCGSACGAGAPGGCGTACSGALQGSALAECHWTLSGRCAEVPCLTARQDTKHTATLPSTYESRAHHHAEAGHKAARAGLGVVREAKPGKVVRLHQLHAREGSPLLVGRAGVVSGARAPGRTAAQVSGLHCQAVPARQRACKARAAAASSLGPRGSGRGPQGAPARAARAGAARACAARARAARPRGPPPPAAPRWSPPRRPAPPPPAPPPRAGPGRARPRAPPSARAPGARGAPARGSPAPPRRAARAR